MVLGMTKLLLLLLQATAAHGRNDPGSARRRRRHHHLLSRLTPRHPSTAACFLACLLALVAATNLAIALTLHRPADPAEPRGGGDGSGYAVVINTWKRYGLLRRAVAHYSGCAGVDAVHVVWSEPHEPPEALRRSVLNCSRRPRGGAAATEVRFVMNRGDSLNNRFRLIQWLRRDAVFSVHDDLIVPCSTLRFAFAVWRSAPSAMVGFVPRMHWLADTRRNTKEY